LQAAKWNLIHCETTALAARSAGSPFDKSIEQRQRLVGTGRHYAQLGYFVENRLLRLIITVSSLNATPATRSADGVSADGKPH